MARASSGAIDSWVRRSNCFSGGIGRVLVHTTSRTELAFRRSVAGSDRIGCVVAMTTEAAPSASSASEACTMVPADRKSTRLNSSHVAISYAVFCLKKKKEKKNRQKNEE